MEYPRPLEVLRRTLADKRRVALLAGCLLVSPVAAACEDSPDNESAHVNTSTDSTREARIEPATTTTTTTVTIAETDVSQPGLKSGQPLMDCKPPDADKDQVPDDQDELPGFDDYGDADGDGLVNKYDAKAHNPDSDGDGVADGKDKAPGDPEIRTKRIKPDLALNPFMDHDSDGIKTGIDKWPLEADHNKNGVIDGKDPQIKSRKRFFIESLASNGCVKYHLPRVGNNMQRGVTTKDQPPDQIPDDPRRSHHCSPDDSGERCITPL